MISATLSTPIRIDRRCGKGWEGEIGDCKRAKIKGAATLAKSAAAWGAGKVVGGAVAGVAQHHGIPGPIAARIAESATQALFNTALQAKGKTPAQLAADFISESIGLWSAKDPNTIDDAIAGGDDHVKALVDFALTTNTVAAASKMKAQANQLHRLFKRPEMRLDSVNAAESIFDLSIVAMTMAKTTLSPVRRIDTRPCKAPWDGELGSCKRSSVSNQLSRLGSEEVEGLRKSLSDEGTGWMGELLAPELWTTKSLKTEADNAQSNINVIQAIKKGEITPQMADDWNLTPGANGKSWKEAGTLVEIDGQSLGEWQRFKNEYELALSIRKKLGLKRRGANANKTLRQLNKDLDFQLYGKEDSKRLHTDDATPVKRILKWQGFEIGLQYLPFEKRHRRVLPAAYGHFRRTRGADGMAVDVYVGTNLASPRIFVVDQMIDGVFDEEKMIIGVNDAAEARMIYGQAMPEAFFGGMREISLAELEQYRTQGLTKADANPRRRKKCGCDCDCEECEQSRKDALEALLKLDAKVKGSPCNAERGWVGMKKPEGKGCKRAKKGTAQRVRKATESRSKRSARSSKSSPKRATLTPEIQRQLQAYQAMPELTFEDFGAKREAKQAITSEIRKSLKGKTNPGLWLKDGLFEIADFEDFGVGDNELKSSQSVKEFYKEMSRQFHPDRGGTAEQMANLNKLRDQMESISKLSRPASKTNSSKRRSKKPKARRRKDSTKGKECGASHISVSKTCHIGKGVGSLGKVDFKKVMSNAGTAEEFKPSDDMQRLADFLSGSDSEALSEWAGTEVSPKQLQKKIDLADKSIEVMKSHGINSLDDFDLKIEDIPWQLGTDEFDKNITAPDIVALHNRLKDSGADIDEAKALAEDYSKAGAKSWLKEAQEYDDSPEALEKAQKTYELGTDDDFRKGYKALLKKNAYKLEGDAADELLDTSSLEGITRSKETAQKLLDPEVQNFFKTLYSSASDEIDEDTLEAANDWLNKTIEQKDPGFGRADAKSPKTPCNNQRGWVGTKPGCKRAKPGTAARVRRVNEKRQQSQSKPVRSQKSAAKRMNRGATLRVIEGGVSDQPLQQLFKDADRIGTSYQENGPVDLTARRRAKKAANDIVDNTTAKAVNKAMGVTEIAPRRRRNLSTEFDQKIKAVRAVKDPDERARQARELALEAEKLESRWGRDQGLSSIRRKTSKLSREMFSRTQAPQPKRASSPVRISKKQGQTTLFRGPDGGYFSIDSRDWDAAAATIQRLDAVRGVWHEGKRTPIVVSANTREEAVKKANKKKHRGGKGIASARKLKGTSLKQAKRGDWVREGPNGEAPGESKLRGLGPEPSRRAG